MGYFDDYLKTLNQDGETMKRRLITRREKEFDKYLKRSIYYSNDIVSDTEIHFEGSIQPTKDSEKTCIYTLLTYKTTVLEPGTLIYNNNNTWLITHKTLDDTLGHNRYVLMLMPIILTIINGDDRNSFPARITNDSALAIEDFFSTLSASNRQYREPDRNITAICKNYSFLKKDQKFIIEGDTYKIEGVNKTASPGCVYLTLGQCLTDESLNDGTADDTNNSFWGVD